MLDYYMYTANRWRIFNMYICKYISIDYIRASRNVSVYSMRSDGPIQNRVYIKLAKQLKMCASVRVHMMNTIRSINGDKKGEKIHETEKLHTYDRIEQYAVYGVCVCVCAMPSMATRMSQHQIQIKKS